MRLGIDPKARIQVGVDRAEFTAKTKPKRRRPRRSAWWSARAQGPPGGPSGDRPAAKGIGTRRPAQRIALASGFRFLVDPSPPSMSGRHRLNGTVGDDPKRKEAADQEERLAPALGRAVGQDGLKVDRDADDEPDIPRPNRNIRARLRRFTRGSCDASRPMPRRISSGPADRREGTGPPRSGSRPSTAAIPQTAAWNPASARRAAPRKKPQPLHRVLRPGQQADTQRKRPPVFFWCQKFHGGFRGHLGQVLCHARHALHRHDKGDRGCNAPARIKLRQRHQRADLKRKPSVERGRKPEARGQPAGARFVTIPATS